MKIYIFILITPLLFGFKGIEEKKYIAKIPFETKGSHVLLKAEINKSDNVYLLFDTGASHNMISEEFANEIKMNITDSVDVISFGGKVKVGITQNNDLTLGDIHLKNQEFTLMKGIYSNSSGKKVVGIIGGIFLFNYIVKIDYDNKFLYLYDTNHKYNNKGDIIQFKFRNMMPVIKGEFVISDKLSIKGDIAFDTGASVYSLINPVTANKYKVLDYFDYSVPYDMMSMGGRFKVEKVRAKSLRFGNQVLDNIPVDIQTSGAPSIVSEGEKLIGFIGIGLLKRYDVTINYPKREIVLEKNKLHNHPFNVDLMGFKMKFDKDKNIKVLKIKKNSSAELAKLKPDDIIFKIDKKEVKNMTPVKLSKYFRKKGKEFSISIVRNGETKKLHYKVVDIL